MCGQKTAESEVEGKERNGGRGKNMRGVGRGGSRRSIQQGRTSNGETSIKSVSKGMCVWGRQRIREHGLHFCMSASQYLHYGAQIKDNIMQVRSKVTTSESAQGVGGVSSGS